MEEAVTMEEGEGAAGSSAGMGGTVASGAGGGGGGGAGGGGAVRVGPETLAELMEAREATAAEAVQRRTGSCLGQVIQAGEENSGERRVRFSAEAVARWAALFSTMAERSRFATVRLMGISRCVATAATMGILGRRTMARTPAERFFRITARQLCST